MGKGSNGAVLAERRKNEARAFAEEIAPLILELLPHGRRRMTLKRLAGELNVRGIPTRQGGYWHPNTVSRVMKNLPPEAIKELECRSLKAFQAGFGQNFSEVMAEIKNQTKKHSVESK